VKKILITQSNYIPWKGYFDAIHQVDEVILYDDVQYTRRDWRNRNVIKTAKGASWLSIPVEVKGKFHQKIRETKISDKNWNRAHWKTLCSGYAKVPHFKESESFIQSLYLNATMQYLSEINFMFLTEICKRLGITTPMRFSDSFDLSEKNPTQRLVSICKQAGASHYFSGPAAKAYLEEDKFLKENIVVSYINYENYREYPQLCPPFLHFVSILDLLFNTGENFARYMKSFQDEA
jgi:hypothetical protein